MSVNTNNTESFAETQESGASGAPVEGAKGTNLYANQPHIGASFGRMRKGKVQGDIKGAFNALNNLLQLCNTQGTYLPFRNSLTQPELDANRAALAIISTQLTMVEAALERAEAEHLSNLRSELAALERRVEQTK